ncbi:MAG TPA: SDR family NAD(P)-dependent oxidoreductase [Acidimicrobiales bacterium]|nr:SDR family NAD(P)-dependent oxidoreductase [Acidimicrobiales bacterium]
MTDRIAVVTGGASGMGRATCHELAKRGCPVAVLDLDGEGAGEVAERLRSSGAGALGIGVDVADRPAVNEAFAEVRADLGAVSILVTSAGLTGFVPFREMTLDAWHRMLEVNLTGTFNCCQAAIDDMVATGWGRIVTISSSSAQRGSPRMAHYAASKGGVIALTKSLAREFAPFGITVNNIPPSGIETPMLRTSQDHGDLQSDEAMARSIPLGHLGTAEDIAAAVGFLCSDEAGFITGQVLGVNGGSVI